MFYFLTINSNTTLFQVVGFCESVFVSLMGCYSISPTYIPTLKVGQNLLKSEETRKKTNRTWVCHLVELLRLEWSLWCKFQDHHQYVDYLSRQLYWNLTQHHPVQRFKIITKIILNWRKQKISETVIILLSLRHKVKELQYSHEMLEHFWKKNIVLKTAETLFLTEPYHYFTKVFWNGFTSKPRGQLYSDRKCLFWVDWYKIQFHFSDSCIWPKIYYHSKNQLPTCKSSFKIIFQTKNYPHNRVFEVFEWFCDKFCVTFWSLNGLCKEK